MRRRARLLHVLLSAPAAAALAFAAIAPAPALADSAPQPYTIVVDPGHGGSPDPNNPQLTYDSGALGLDGLVEKDITLDVSKRLRTLLQSDLVHVVLTRDTDIPMGIDQRSAIANASNADLFVSVHFNAYTDPAIGGSLVLYPGQKDVQFAQIMDQRLAAHFRPYGIGDGGPQLRDNWWISIHAPVVTVEPAYVTNQHEADLLATESFREVVAEAVKDGIETYRPDILSRKQALLAWQRSQSASSQGGAVGAAVSGVSLATGGSGILHWLLLIAAGAAAVRFRRPLWRVTRFTVRVGMLLARHSLIHRNAKRRRRRQVRERALVARSARLARPQSVYDELFL